MPFNNGVFSLPEGWAAVTGTVIQSGKYNQTLSDIAAAINVNATSIAGVSSQIVTGALYLGSTGNGDTYIEFHNNFDSSGPFRFGFSALTGNWYFRDGGGAVSEVVSTANLRQKLAVSLTGDIGEVATLKNKTGGLVGKGVEVNGTQLAYSGTNSTGVPTEGSAPAGRWSAQSVTQNGGIGVFVRIM